MPGQEHQRNEYLNANWQAQDEEGEEICEGDLRQDIDQLKLELAAGNIYQHLTEYDQHDGAPGYVPKDLPHAVALCTAIGKGERHCHTHHEHESGLNEIPKNESLPLDVLELC